MKNFVVGDIQGCYKGLRKLLKKAKFDPKTDKLWAVGDLIARGSESLETMQYLVDLGDSFETVLGNHDLHLVAIAHGLGKPKPQDKLDSLIKHKKFSSYIDYLLSKPLAVSPQSNLLITHAGLYPKWSIERALELSSEVQSQLQSKDPTAFLSSMYGNMPNLWHKDMEGDNRYRFIVNACTRMRFVNKDKSLEFTNKSHPQNAPAHLLPWFMLKNSKVNAEDTIIFGHWASLMGQIPNKTGIKGKAIALDTGYVWGNTLSLYCIESQKIIQQQA